jgi:integrase/recombinase XerD
VNPKIETEPLADWYPLTQQFKLTLKVSGRSPRTAEAYDFAIRELLHYLVKVGLRIGPSDVTAEHLRMFFSSLMDHCAPATINQRYRSLNRFFGWVVEEGERPDNPVARIPVPKVPQRTVRALSLDQVRSMLKVPDRKTFLGARDYAMILCLVDTGLRASEFLSMRTSEENHELIVVIGRGTRSESCAWVRSRNWQ